MGIRVYRWLLRLLPGDFRREFAGEMCQVVLEHWRAVRGRVGPWGACRFWARQWAAVVKAAVTSRTGRGGGQGIAAPSATGQRRDEGRGSMEGIWQDIRHSLRALVKRPVFSLVTVLTLGLGVGAATALFSAVHAVLFRELPYEDPDRIVAIYHEDTRTGERGGGLSAANALDLATEVEGLSEVAVAEPWSLDMLIDGRAESLRGWAVSEGFFEALGVEAGLGRTFLQEEYREGGESVVVLGHRTWTRRFGADPSTVGRTITLDGQGVRVVGVLPSDFKIPDEAEIWTPRQPQSYDDASRAADYMMGVGRLAPGASLTRVEDEVDRLAASLAELYPRTNANTGFRLIPLREQLFGGVRTPLMVLMGAVGFVLLIACANVAGLMLARGAEREREYALRSALGASAGRLVRHVTAESVLIAVGGCALGVALTYGGVHAIRSLGPDHLPRIEELRVDGVVLTFALAAAALSAMLAGLAPSLRLSRPDLRDMLDPGSRGTTAGRRRAGLRSRLVVLEIAAAMVLLVGAGLLVRSFAVLLDEELGFEPADRLALQMFSYDHADHAERMVFVDRVRQEMEALPGVRDVAVTTNIPAATDGAVASIEIDLPIRIADRAPPPEGHEPRATVSEVTPGYFDLMGIPVVAGRAVVASDDASSRPVVVINETLARRHFGEESPLGRGIFVSPQEPFAREVVGVVGDVRPGGFESDPRPEAYRPLAQAANGSLTFVLRTDGDAAALAAPAREAVWAVTPTQSVWGVATLEELLADWLKERRFNLMLLSGFSVIALLLAAVGIYGLISFSVEQRVSELGIRRALGGRSSDLVGMVLRQGAVLAGVGVALGGVGALVLTRFLQGMLYGVEPTDPVTFVVLAGAVLSVAGVAALVPALRAVRVDPMVALRSE